MATNTNVESPVLSRWLMVLAVAGALNAAIAAGYYLRVVGAMYFRPGTTTFAERGGSGGMGAAVICGILTVLLGLSPTFVLSSTRQAERSAYHHPDSTTSYTGVAPASAPVARR
jgi:NADH:ubiquinone oxidoreductase subunit 2 (subunit N)